MPYELGSKKQVFVDWDFVEPGYGLAVGGDGPTSWEMSNGIKLAVHPPRVESTPIIEPDQPWELDMNWHTSMFEDEGRIRVYYRTYDITGGPTKNLKDTYRLAYAESEDGVNWVKPILGTHELNGSTDNNIVDLGRPAWSPVVFKDPSADDDERYKLVFRGETDGVHEIRGATSADGLRWNLIEKPLLSNYSSDTHNVISYSEAKGKYVGYWRGRRPVDGAAPQIRRTIAYAETDDFRTWPKPQTIVEPDVQDGPHTDVYTNSYSAWPGANAHLMFPSLFERERDILEMHLFTSRDGLKWERISRDPVIPQGEPGTFAENGVWAGAGLVSISPGEWSLPVSTLSVTHNHNPYPDAKDHRLHHGHISLATWREDGFTSIGADSVGSFSTVPFVLEGGKLELNTWSNYGGLIQVELVEVVDERIRSYVPAVDGRGLDDCDVITGDNLRQTVTWNGESDISAWSGKNMRLRFKLRRSRLHAMRIT